MRLSLALLKQFQELHLNTFGEQITLETAELELLDLAELVRITKKLNKETEDE